MRSLLFFFLVVGWAYQELFTSNELIPLDDKTPYILRRGTTLTLINATQSAEIASHYFIEPVEKIDTVSFFPEGAVGYQIVDSSINLEPYVDKQVYIEGEHVFYKGPLLLSLVRNSFSPSNKGVPVIQVKSVKLVKRDDLLRRP